MAKVNIGKQGILVLALTPDMWESQFPVLEAVARDRWRP